LTTGTVSGRGVRIRHENPGWVYETSTKMRGGRTRPLRGCGVGVRDLYDDAGWAYETSTKMRGGRARPLSFWGGEPGTEDVGGAGAVVVAAGPGRASSCDGLVCRPVSEDLAQHLLEGVGVGFHDRRRLPLRVEGSHPLPHGGRQVPDD